MQQIKQFFQTVAFFYCFIETCLARPDEPAEEPETVWSTVEVEVSTTVTWITPTTTPPRDAITTTITLVSTRPDTTYTVPVTDDVSAVVEEKDNQWFLVSTIQELSWKSVTGRTSIYLGIANAPLCDWNADSEMVTCEGTTFAYSLSTSDYLPAAATTTPYSPQHPTVTITVSTGLSTSHDATSLASSSSESQSGTTSSTPTAKASTQPASSSISAAGLAGAISGSSFFVFVAIPLGFFIIKRRRKRQDTSTAPYPEHTNERADIDSTMPQENELAGQCSHIDSEKMPSDWTFSDHISPIDGPELEAKPYQPYAEFDDTIASHELHDPMRTEVSTEWPRYELDTRQDLRPSEKELWFST